MNILPQKSWHVRTRKNIERVRRDEEKAAEEEKEKQRKIALAEQEARTELLRQRSKHRRDEVSDSSEKHPRLTAGAEGGSPSTSTADIYTKSGHINFFKEVEAGEVKHGKNAEHEAEKKAEKEKWEKDIGLLTYLGQSAVETQEKPPWYLSSREKKKPTDNFSVKDGKLKDSLDPIHEMSAYVHKAKKHKHKSEHKDKHHKHKHKKKIKDKVEDKTDRHSSASKTIEQLRAERLRRELEERQRTQNFLQKKHGGPEVKVREEESLNERDRGYNSVFNPDLVRKPKKKHSYDKYGDDY